jgi:5-methylcytosine-specific restriction endonuclease McrA
MSTLRELLIDRIVEDRSDGKHQLFTCRCPTPGCSNVVSVWKKKHINKKCRACSNLLRQGQILSSHLAPLKDKIVEIRRSSHNKPRYIFKCSTDGCPNTTTPKTESIQKGEIFCRECRNNQFKKRPYERSYNHLKKRCKEKQLEGQILTYEEYEQLCSIEYCHYCGKFLNRAQYKSQPGSDAILIDRKDSSKGYTVDNSVPCCPECNNNKAAWMNDKEFQLLMFLRKANIDPETIYSQLK